ncbi:RrF2 family transcriptional regulator [Autumnicola musiva]|uniref:Rrf2 family transcriptional regulator n=1 Tax=Autumnicola musiva TaxID=3075589 RepID=A0ABU3DA96_9FLAO|nr:Rrf2 family transcriptional regulator [Zunongwangia sp. F117]MDT0678466.1 Rrf2 family transcriptional regulator [Zunongwangia sp. F117]
MFSKACEYGIRATLYIARQSQIGMRPNLSEIAGAVNSPEAFTAKIMQKLAKNNVVESRKGPSGGFFIDPSSKTKLIAIVEAIDGDVIYNGCGLGLAECSEAHPCPLHDEFVSIRGELKEMLKNTTIHGLAGKLESEHTFLKF